MLASLARGGIVVSGSGMKYTNMERWWNDTDRGEPESVLL